jgi:putative hemolysin
MLTDASLLLTLILLNGVFAMSEFALVGSRRARLVQLADGGHAGAARAVALSSDPTRFLSTVQVGITAIGILIGAVGEASIASRLRAALEGFPVLARYADGLSLAVTVIGLTYLSLVIGELVPKRLALTRPERIASLIARPMQVLSTIGHPVIALLSISTDTVLRLMRVRKVKEPVVSLDEFKVLVEQATAQGVFEKTEQELVTNILDLDERNVGEILTPRSDIVFLDVRAGAEQNRETVSQAPHSVVPLCDGGLDHVIGFIRSNDLLTRLLRSEPLDFSALASPPSFVPRTVSLMRLLEQFKRTHLPVALVVDEFGDIDGLVSLTDVMSAIVGELPGEPGEEPAVVRREDGSWLIDGMLDLDGVKRAIGLKALAGEEEETYHTLGGLAMRALGRVPRTGDVFEQQGFRFEVVDMDGNRVDRVLVSRRPVIEAEDATTSDAHGDRQTPS